MSVISTRTTRIALLGGAALALVAFGIPRAEAQSEMGSRELQAAELGELSPELRAEVLSRATGTNTPRGVLETILLNSISQRFPASRIVGIDFGRGVVVIATAENQLRALNFNKQGLTVLGEVSLTRN